METDQKVTAEYLKDQETQETRLSFTWSSATHKTSTISPEPLLPAYPVKSKRLGIWSVVQETHSTHPSLLSPFVSENSKPEPVRILFTLVYLPKYVAEADIRTKLTGFGKLSHFDYKPEIDQKLGSTRGDKAFFHRVEFSFEIQQVMFAFMSIKRLRIQGLQLKVLHSPLPLSVKNSPRLMVPSELEHSVKPTRKTYFVHRAQLV